MRIAVDAMGSDHCPGPDVRGAVLAAREYGVAIALVGDEHRIKAELGQADTAGLKIDVVPAAEQILMTDKPAVVGKAKPHSSMHVGMRLVKDRSADAFVSAGNTGALLTIATLNTLQRIRGVRRPALSSIIRLGARSIILLDIGANADSKPEWLMQFAVMGEIYARKGLGLAKPRVGLLSNGEEEGKGDQLVRESAALMKSASFNYVGYVEPHQLFRDKADVVVSDGFVGNILLKSLEGTTSMLIETIRGEIRSNPITALGGLLATPAFRRVRAQIDPFEVGGAPLLGVDGVVIKAHGRTNDIGIKNAVRQAKQAVAGGILDAIREQLGRTAASDE